MLSLPFLFLLILVNLTLESTRTAWSGAMLRFEFVIASHAPVESFLPMISVDKMKEMIAPNREDERY